MKRLQLVVGICFGALVAIPIRADADVEISCLPDQFPHQLSEVVSVTDLTDGGRSTQLIIQLPIRFSNLELELIHLRRFEEGKRTLWVGLSFEELEEGKSWTSIEVARADLGQYQIFAQYRVIDKDEDGCASFEIPFGIETKP